MHIKLPQDRSQKIGAGPDTRLDCRLTWSGFRLRQVLILILLVVILTVGQVAILAADATTATVLDAKQAEDEALAADLSLQAAKLDLEIARNDWDGARQLFSVGSYYYNVNTNGSGQWEAPSQEISINSGGTFDSSTNNVFSKWWIDITPPTYSTGYTSDYYLNAYPFNFYYEGSIKTAELNYSAKNLTYETIRIKLITDVRNAYAAAFQREKLYQLAGEDLDLLKDQFQKSQLLYDAGKIPRLDLLDAEQQVKAAQAKLASADLNRQAGLLDLSTLIHQDNLTGVVLKGETLNWAATEKIDLQGTIARYLKTGPEVKPALLNVDIARFQNLTDASYLLKYIFVGAGIYKDSSGNPYMIYKLGFTGPLDNEYLRDKQRSNKQLEAARFNLAVLNRNKQTQIMDAYHNWQIMELSLGPLQDSLDIAKERLRIVLLKYESGIASGTDVNQANLTLTESQENYWNAWLNLQQARESFYQAVSGNPVFIKN